jgi:anti-sigma B factor antagonist
MRSGCSRGALSPNYGYSWVRCRNWVYSHPMETRQEVENGVTVVTLSGRMDAPAAPEAQQAFVRVIDEKPPHVLLDMSGVEYISSGGLRAVIMLSKALHSTNAALKLCGLNPFVKEVFAISHLDDIFDIHSDRQTAIAAFGSS